MDENKMRVVVDREADGHPMTKLVKGAQAILAAHLVPIGPSKADTIAQLVELFGGAPFFAALEQSQSTAPAPDPMTALMERVDQVWEKLDQSGVVTTEDVQGLRAAIQAMTPARRELTDDEVYDAQPHGAQHTDDGRYVVNDEWLEDFAHNILKAAGAK